jgi:hypothetical protein
MDSYRESFYIKGFKVFPWVIPNTYVHNEFLCDKKLREIIRHCLESPCSLESLEFATHQILMGRKEVESRIPGLFGANGKELHLFGKEYEGRIKATVSYGGIRVVINAIEVESPLAA